MSERRVGALTPSVRGVERIPAQLAPDSATFSRHFGLVMAYVKSQPGSHAALMAAARQEPEEMTMSIVALGAVLLDTAAGAFRITPDQMLDKVAESIRTA
ncbi:MAG: hypothetical protein JWO22_3256 [Frankiales bacterium]|nr:hypothetical protein [Frankiales bacterium]